MNAVKFKVEFGAKGRRPVGERKPPAPAPVRVSSGARQLALAHWIERRIEAGELRDLADAARLLGVTRARVSQIADMLLLPITVQEQVLAPGYRGSERSLRKVQTEMPNG